MFISEMGAMDGSVTVGTTGATEPYSYLWSTGDVTQTVTGLGAGIYSVTVTSVEGCVCSSSVTLHNPEGEVCETREISDVEACAAFGYSYSFFSANLFNGITTSTNYLIQDGSFTEYVDGTARLLATFVNQSEPTISFDADVTLYRKNIRSTDR